MELNSLLYSATRLAKLGTQNVARFYTWAQKVAHEAIAERVTDVLTTF